MMQQDKLFDNAAPLARSSDPVTSHLAGEYIKESGGRDKQKRAVLSFLASQPAPLTSSEIAQQARLGRYMVARRLPDLERDGKVRRHEARVCRVSGRPCITWSVRGSDCRGAAQGLADQVAEGLLIRDEQGDAL